MILTLAGWVAALAASVWVLRLRLALDGRTELVARACHELRRPLAAARLGIGLVAQDSPSRPDTLRAIDLELASAGVALEDLSAALAGQLGPTRFDAVDAPVLLTDSLAALRPLARARGVDLAMRWEGPPAALQGDRIRLAQATGNLIANAIEHGQGRVELHGTAKNDHLEIEVTDQGPGLPAPLPTITKRAHRGHGHRGRGHRGRGLAIAAHIAQHHGGQLTASTDGRSRLTLSLPLRKS
jgi:signal transduction histidine kinase